MIAFVPFPATELFDVGGIPIALDGQGNARRWRFDALENATKNVAEGWE